LICLPTCITLKQYIKIYLLISSANYILKLCRFSFRLHINFFFDLFYPSSVLITNNSIEGDMENSSIWHLGYGSTSPYDKHILILFNIVIYNDVTIGWYFSSSTIFDFY